MLHLSITCLSITYFIRCTTRYTMRRTRVPCKVTRSTKLRFAQHSPELALRSMDFRAPENLNFPALHVVSSLMSLNVYLVEFISGMWNEYCNFYCDCETNLVMCLPSLFNPFDPRRREKINLNFYFHSSLCCLKRF